MLRDVETDDMDGLVVPDSQRTNKSAREGSDLPWMGSEWHAVFVYHAAHLHISKW